MFGIQSDGTPGAIPLDKDLEQGLESMSFLDSLKGLGFEDAVSKIAHSLINFGFKLFVAILVFYLGRFVIKKIFKLVFKTMTSRQVDASLTTFVLSLVKITLYFILIITVIGILGIETSSFIAIFASAGVALGMALSGTLQNFAGGVLILLLKPYKVGDYIEAQGFAGYVREIQIFSTIISTYDNKSIIIPNGGLSTGSINNWSREAYRRVEWTVSISYGDNVPNARQAILEILNSDPRIVEKYIEDDQERFDLEHPSEECSENPSNPECEDTPVKKKNVIIRIFHRHRRRVAQKVEALREETEQRITAANPKVDRSPSVSVNSLAASSVDLVARAWTRSENYWGLFYDINERLYSELPGKGVNFPFPQLNVHLRHPETSKPG